MMELNPSKAQPKPATQQSQGMQQGIAGSRSHSGQCGWGGKGPHAHVGLHMCIRESPVLRERLSAVLSPGLTLLVVSPAGHREGQSTP